MTAPNRRSFLRGIAGAAGSLASAGAHTRPPDPASLTPRQQAALALRQKAALFEANQPPPAQANNGDETNVPGYLACFTKGMPHSQLGEVDPAAYQTLLYAMSTGQQADFEKIERGDGMKFVNPEAAFTYDLEGADSHCLSCPPPPSFTSDAAAAEMVELYWQALARDTAFADYRTSALIQAAGQELGQASSSTIFRWNLPGCLDGPYISQFLWKPIPINSTWVDQRYRVPAAGIDYLTDFPEWLVLQSGLPPYRPTVFDSTPRYLRDGRGLAEWVHYDFLYQGFHYAALILMNLTPESILNTNPYWNPANPYKLSRVQTGFATFGAPHICGWLGRVTTAALEAAWYQKWGVHRRLRPEEFGGRVHQTLNKAASYPISPQLLNSAAVNQTFNTNGTYLLPQAYAEGCPLHPSFPAGHATVAGACSALLKAFFDENGLVTDCVMASADGLSLMPYDGVALTVGGEINKLAANIAMGRNFAGIHYRTDAAAGFELGENVAIAMLQDLVNTLTEDFPGFVFTRLNGTSVAISPTR